MKIIDLTAPLSLNMYDKQPAAKIKTGIVPVVIEGKNYSAYIYDLEMGSMAGTYIDFPGHIKETFEGTDAANCPMEKLYRLKASVIHMECSDGHGAVSAEDLKSAFGGNIETPAVIINALGKTRFDGIKFRSVYLDRSAVEWIINSGIHLIVSDIYESQQVHGVFRDFFKNRIFAVCCAVNMHLIDASVCYLTILPVHFTDATQVPCRVIAEWD